MKRPVAALACLSVLLGLAGCERNGCPLSHSGGAGLESDFAVYRAILSDSVFMRCSVIVMVDSTAIGPGRMLEEDWAHFRERLPEASRETWVNFRLRNAGRVPLGDFQCPGRSIVFLDSRSSWDWERTVPGSCGAITVSLAGFNRDRTEALVYWSVYSAPLAAYGSLILLNNKRGEWVVSREVMIWIS